MKKIIMINGDYNSGKDYTAELLIKKGYERFAFADKLKEYCSYILDITTEDFENYKNNSTQIEISNNIFLKRLKSLLFSINYEVNNKTNYSDEITSIVDEMFIDNVYKCLSFILDSEILNKQGLIFRNLRFEYLNGNYIFNARYFIQDIGTLIRKIFDDKIFINLIEIAIDNSNSEKIVISDFRYKIEFDCLFETKETKSIKTIYIKNDQIVNNDSHSSENDLNDFKFDYILDNSVYDGRLETQINKIKGI